MLDATLPPKACASDMDVDMDEAHSLPSGFVHRNPNIINLEKDGDYDSDDTLLDDEIVERVVPPVSEARQNRRQARTQTDSFRNLQIHIENGRTIQVGRTVQDQDGNFLRIISIKQHRESGAIVIESFQDNHRILQTHSYDGRTLKPDKTVEMTDGAFLRIASISQDRRTGRISLKGSRFERATSLNGLLEFKLNEVAMIMKYDQNDVRDITEESLHEVSIAAVVRIRELVMTNQQFPALSFRETDPAGVASSKEYSSAHCRLICRWKFLKISENEGVLRRLMDFESDKGCSVPQAELRTTFRGRTIKGGACPGWLDEEIAFQRAERKRSRNIDPLRFHRPRSIINEATNRHHQRRYTLCDGFSGCGGVSRGAQEAGLRIESAFDQDADTVATYNLNFPYAKCEAITAYDFAMSINGNYKTDVLHLSPPCPRFSPFHNRPFPNDEQYEATFLATETLIRKTTPRIVTLEETFGLTRTEENLEWFNAMIQMFTKLGFSVRWKEFNLLDFGLPQPRRRLFVFASW